MAPHSGTQVRPAGRGRENRPVSPPAGLSEGRGVPEPGCPADSSVQPDAGHFSPVRPAVCSPGTRWRSVGRNACLAANPAVLLLLPPGPSLPHFLCNWEVRPSALLREERAPHRPPRRAVCWASLRGRQMSFGSGPALLPREGQGFWERLPLRSSQTRGSRTGSQHRGEGSAGHSAVPTGDPPVWT